MYSGGSDSIEITGGSVNATKVNPQPTNGIDSVYFNTLTVGSSPVKNTEITAGSVDGTAMEDTPSPTGGYGINDVKTDKDGKLYFWPTAAGDSELVKVADDSDTYGACFTRSSDNNTAQILRRWL